MGEKGNWRVYSIEIGEKFWENKKWKIEFRILFVWENERFWVWILFGKGDWWAGSRRNWRWNKC